MINIDYRDNDMIVILNGITFPGLCRMLTTATKTCSIWTSHVNTGKRCVNVVTFVVVRILCTYRDIIVIEIILSVLSRYSFSHYRPGLFETGGSGIFMGRSICTYQTLDNRILPCSYMQ